MHASQFVIIQKCDYNKNDATCITEELGGMRIKNANYKNHGLETQHNLTGLTFMCRMDSVIFFKTRTSKKLHNNNYFQINVAVVFKKKRTKRLIFVNGEIKFIMLNS